MSEMTRENSLNGYGKDGKDGKDWIEIRCLRCLGTHGVLPEERIRPQLFMVDVDIQADMEKAGITDDLSDTADYGSIAQLIHREIHDKSFRLLEALADHLAKAILSNNPTVNIVSLRLSKLHAPVPVDIESVGVRVWRERQPTE